MLSCFLATMHLLAGNQRAAAAAPLDVLVGWETPEASGNSSRKEDVSPRRDFFLFGSVGTPGGGGRNIGRVLPCHFLKEEGDGTLLVSGHERFFLGDSAEKPGGVLLPGRGRLRRCGGRWALDVRGRERSLVVSYLIGYPAGG